MLLHSFSCHTTLFKKIPLLQSYLKVVSCLIFALQKLVNEIKSLIKEQRREGKRGPLDLTSSEVSEKLEQRQLRKRQSHMRSMEDSSGDEVTSDGLISAMTQLAWEKDIDLSRAQPTKNLVGEAIQEEEPTDQNASANLTKLGGKPSNVKAGTGKTVTPVTKGSSNISQNNNAPPAKAVVTDSKGEAKDSKFHSPIGRSTRVAPHDMAGQPVGEAGAKPLQRPETTPVNTRPRSKTGGRPITGKGGEERGKRMTLAVTGSKSSLNSASSLTSLLHGAWEGKQKPQQDNTEF